ncbi:polysaccharide deacetylase family protein [Streptomyces tsukubensis]|uniref:Polysaccharide deacetylase n=1 Tax=Streptomyces tsukubensis TaxID=83656 RepID=A0A1V4ABE3_9ACTN|nr:polysaccharide deacetylase family protein [Streptomyces tsukubensis]OON80601.1 polysaccharide deacetylase [Streptomyces tsukubensis]QFR96256.1 polysaccharide deacetylase family protein [Streptomyces tsukubensis]
MILYGRRLTALCVLGAVGALTLTACGVEPPRVALETVKVSPGAPGATASQAPRGQGESEAPGHPDTPSSSGPPTLTPGPGGRAPVFTHGPRTGHGKTVAFTFDADMTADQGPRAASGERFDNPGLIAALRALRVPSTVFMTGRWAEEYPAEAKNIGADPLFEVANHSYSHYSFTGDCYGLPSLAPTRMRSDVERAFTAFRRAGVRHRVPYFRFPGGCHDVRSLRAVAPEGVTAVQWDVVSGDAFATDTDAVVRQVLDGVRPGSVVVMHCTRSAAPTTEAVVRRVVPELRKRGYRFVKVSGLVAEAAAAAAGKRSH